MGGEGWIFAEVPPAGCMPATEPCCRGHRPPHNPAGLRESLRPGKRCPVSHAFLSPDVGKLFCCVPGCPGPRTHPRSGAHLVRSP